MTIMLLLGLLLIIVLPATVLGWSIFIRNLFVKTYYSESNEFDELSYYVISPNNIAHYKL
jgi:hypothetical protein